MSYIIVDNISKTFKVTKRNSGLKSALKSFIKREYSIVEAVKNVSFEIDEGEIVGYIGPNGVRIPKIGCTGNYDGKSYVIHFLHEDKIDENVRVTIVGQNTSGFTMAYAKDSETVIDVEFSALPSDELGTLVIIQEETDATA